jgi:hypothetical protein
VTSSAHIVLVERVIATSAYFVEYYISRAHSLQVPIARDRPRAHKRKRKLLRHGGGGAAAACRPRSNAVAKFDTLCLGHGRVTSSFRRYSCCRRVRPQLNAPQTYIWHENLTRVCCSYNEQRQLQDVKRMQRRSKAKLQKVPGRPSASTTRRRCPCCQSSCFLYIHLRRFSTRAPLPEAKSRSI